MTRRLIERRLPLLEISEQSAREKSIRHGHISTLHIWWARRPLAACRAAVFGTLVPDNDKNYELVKKLVPWEAVKDGNSDDVLEARRLILEANGGVPPKVLDPFAGGGAIPLEALRLGCETYALDLNPVAHLIQRATLEFPQKFGQPTDGPVPDYIRAKDQTETVAAGKNQQSSAFGEDGEWASAYKQNPLEAEVRYWGEWVLERAREELAEFYPEDEDGKTPVAYLWARTVTCTNPACRAEIPLVRQWWLAKKKGKKIALRPKVDTEAKRVDFEVVQLDDKNNAKWVDDGTKSRSGATCLVCESVTSRDDILEEAVADKWGERLLSVVLTDPNESGKSYRAATEKDLTAFGGARNRLEHLKETTNFDGLPIVPDEPLPYEPRAFTPCLYGFDTWGKLFNVRQALSLVTFAKYARTAHEAMLEHGMEEEMARGVASYLALSHSKMVDLGASLTTWKTDADCPVHVFTRQALPMVWDYAEAVSTSGMSGSWQSMVGRTISSLPRLNVVDSHDFSITVLRGSATRVPLEDGFLDAIVTDPPYYDAVPYADLSDFFYVWLKRTVGHLYPSEFRTPLTPKAQEATQNPVRHGGDNGKAKAFYEDMMTQAFAEMHRVLKPEGQATIVFAHKSTDAWETLISALIKAGFRVEASWPLHTEMATRLRARNSAALASSTFINCSKRVAGQTGRFNQVRREMQELIGPQLDNFWDSGIRGADLFMSAIGPGLEAYSKHDQVKRASGAEVGVSEFLIEVRKIVLEFVLERVFNERSASERLDQATQFALLSLWAYGYEFPSDEARKLAQSSGIELDDLSNTSLVNVRGEKASLLTAKEREKKDKGFGQPRAEAGQVPMVEALQRTLLLLPEGRQAITDYLETVKYRDSESFWRTAQAFAEVLGDEEDEGRAIDELMALRDNLPKPSQAAQAGLFG